MLNAIQEQFSSAIQQQINGYYGFHKTFSEEKLRTIVVIEEFPEIYYVLVYLRYTQINTEFLSSLIITQKALEESNRIKASLKEIETMKKEHYRKFGTWWEKLKNN